MPETGAFKVGDVVEWTSQAAGSTKTKRGTIAAPVAAGMLPGYAVRRLRDGGLAFSGPDAGTCVPRNHESYLVLVQMPASRNAARPRKPRVYWPRVSALEAK